MTLKGVRSSVPFGTHMSTPNVTRCSGRAVGHPPRGGTRGSGPNWSSSFSLLSSGSEPNDHSSKGLDTDDARRRTSSMATIPSIMPGANKERARFITSLLVILVVMPVASNGLTSHTIVRQEPDGDVSLISTSSSVTSEVFPHQDHARRDQRGSKVSSPSIPIGHREEPSRSRRLLRTPKKIYSSLRRSGRKDLRARSSRTPVDVPRFSSRVHDKSFGHNHDVTATLMGPHVMEVEKSVFRQYSSVDNRSGQGHHERHHWGGKSQDALPGQMPIKEKPVHRTEAVSRERTCVRSWLTSLPDFA